MLINRLRPITLGSSVLLAPRRIKVNSGIFQQRSYSSELDPSNKKDYSAYVTQWTTHFLTLSDSFEMERGLNHIFAADWVPNVELIEEALRASRRLNCYATSVRVLEALENKIDDKKTYEQYRATLAPIISELGITEQKEFGSFQTVRDLSRWWY